MTTSKSERARLLNKQFEKEQEAQRLSAARMRRRYDEFLRKKVARRSGKSTRDARRDATADEKLFNAIKASVKAGEQVYLTSANGPPVEDFRKQKTRKHISTKILRTDVQRRYWSPHWDHATDRLKALAWSKVVHNGLAYTMNVNLGADVVGSIKAKGPGFAGHLRDRLSSYLGRYLKPLGVKAPDFFFWVETAVGVAPHIHGAIVIPHNRPDVLDVARRALERAGGDWKPTHKQVLLEEMYYGPGWITYITKGEKGARIRLGDKNIAAATLGMKRAARRWYEDARTGLAPIN